MGIKSYLVQTAVRYRVEARVPDTSGYALTATEMA